MKKTTRRSAPTLGELRRKAEKRLRSEPGTAGKERIEADTQRLVHELQVHQVELNMQNAELQRAQTETEAALEKYTELYDFAPVGYFSIDQRGLIQEVNLMGASMLGAVRTQLLRHRLLDFVSPTSRPVVDLFLRSVAAKPVPQACEALLLTGADLNFWADLHAVSTPAPDGEGMWCRLAVSDISALKRGEEAERSVHSLAAANKEANREIARRRAAEASLKDSEQIQRKLLKESRALHGQLRHLTHQIILAQEEERKQISRDLHDEIAQILAGINVKLAGLNEASGMDVKSLRKRIVQTQHLVEQSVRAVHRYARDLRPSLLDDLGLVPALRSYIRDFPRRNRLRVQFKAFPGVEALSSNQRTVLFRVAQEALTNVTRHAHAHTASVRIRRIKNAVHLEIHDDGRSFAADRILNSHTSTRLGLLGMKERVEMVGGRFSIESAPGKGTTVCADIPFARPERREKA